MTISWVRCTAGAALAVLASCSAGEPAARSALLVTLDGARRDALGAFGAAPSPTPSLDRFAAEALRYEWARSVSPLARPAQASIATGLYPPRHGVRSARDQSLGDRAETVAERARAAGFDTAAFTSNPLLDEGSGLAQGFETFEARSLGEGEGAEEQRASPAEVVDAAVEWLRDPELGSPFFAWVELSCTPRSRPLPAAGADAELGAAYRAQLSAADAAIGRLLAALEQSGRRAETFVAIAGTSGAGQGEHGEFGRGLGLWDSTLRVPLLLRYRDDFGAGESSLETVSVADLAPTLLAAMGLEAKQAADGTSLYYQSLASDRRVYFESYEGWERFGWSPLVGAADAQSKLVRGARDELFDLRRDALELEPKSGGSEAARHAEWIAELQAAPALPEAQRPGPAPELLAELAELGYPTEGALPAAYPVLAAAGGLAGAKDPRDALEQHAEFLRAGDLVRAGAYGAALEPLERLREREPRAPAVLDALAAALLGLGEHARAVEVLRARLCHAPERIETHRDLRICFTVLGDPERARAHSIRSLELLVEHHQRRRDAEGLRRARMLLDHTRRASAAELYAASAPEAAAGAAAEAPEGTEPGSR